MLDVKTSMFFDRPGVMKKVKDGTVSALSKAGAFIRQRAKTSIKTRKKTAKPGNPPSSHDGRLKNMIFFGYDKSTESVVVGPKLCKGSNPTVPHLIEFGGSIIHWRDKKKAHYHAFPFMAPALAKELPNLPAAFQGCVKG
jgi:hypothetical protein